MIRTFLLALLLLTLSGCSVIRAQPVPIPTELVTPAPEPLAPAPEKANDVDLAKYLVDLYFWGKANERKLLEIADISGSKTE